MVKVLTMWDRKDTTTTKYGSLLTYLLDVETSSKKLEEVAKSRKPFIGKLGMENEEDEKRDGQTTDIAAGAGHYVLPPVTRQKQTHKRPMHRLTQMLRL
jgi:hypothetical protein